MSVRRRAICYVSGFDPRGARHYHQLYRNESAKQAELTGCKIDIGKRSKLSDYTSLWQVHAEDSSGNTCEIDYHFLSYDAIIRRNWAKTEWALLKETFFCSLELLRCGLYYRMAKRYYPCLPALVYPLITVCLTIALAAAAWILLFYGTGFDTWIRAIMGLAGIVGALWLGRVVDKQINHYWIIRTISFGILGKYRKDKDFNEAIDEMKNLITQLDEGDAYDEILVIGHSFGSVMAVEAVAKTLKTDANLGKRKAHVSFVSVGSIIPLFTSNEKDVALRDTVTFMTQQKSIDWVDLGARADGAAACMVDPIAFSDLEADRELATLPRLYPVRFFKCFSEKGYKQLKKNKFEFHFQYLKSTEFAGEYDYFRITAGTQFIHEVYPIGSSTSSSNQKDPS